MNNSAKSLLALALFTGMALAPAAQAADINRDTGVGLLIAAQGNVALRAIRATLHLAQPDLKKVRVQKVSLPAPINSGGTLTAEAGLRCAE